MSNEQKYFLKTGGIFACWQPYSVATVLGSGVAVCLCDPIAQIGGVSNFAFPKQSKDKNKEENKRKYMTHYGENSLPHLLKMMYDMGASSKNIEAHIIGGGVSSQYSTKDIGKKNIEIAKKYLKKNKIEIINEDIRGKWGRKVLFNTQNGEVIVYKLRDIRESDWVFN